MVDDYYGCKPQSLKYETAMKNFADKNKLKDQKEI